MSARRDGIPRIAGYCPCRTHEAHRATLQALIDRLEVDGVRRWSLDHGMPEHWPGPNGEKRPFTPELILVALHKMRAVRGSTRLLREESSLWLATRGISTYIPKPPLPGLPRE